MIISCPCHICQFSQFLIIIVIASFLKIYDWQSSVDGDQNPYLYKVIRCVCWGGVCARAHSCACSLFCFQWLHLNQLLYQSAITTLKLSEAVQPHGPQPGGNSVRSGTGSNMTAKGNFI